MSAVSNELVRACELHKEIVSLLKDKNNNSWKLSAKFKAMRDEKWYLLIDGGQEVGAEGLRPWQNGFRDYVELNPEVNQNYSSVSRAISAYEVRESVIECLQNNALTRDNYDNLPLSNFCEAVPVIAKLLEVGDIEGVAGWVADVGVLVQKDIRKNVSDFRRENSPPLKLPDGEFNVIYADPPWSYGDKQNTESLGGAEKHYPTMSIEELCKLKVPASKDAVLFMWVTSPLLDECWPVISSWGFEYKTSFVWDKVKHNMGHYNSVRHELLLICTRGSMTPENPVLFDSVVVEERSDTHSQKPTKFYEIIETLYPSGKYLEMFARSERERWTSWGNEVGILPAKTE